MSIVHLLLQPNRGSRARILISAVLTAAALGLTAVLPAAANPGMSEPTADTYHSDSGAYVTEGQVTYYAPINKVLEVLGDYPGYSEWVPHGLDSHPDPDTELIGVVRDIAYSTYPREQYVLTYDIDLGWPLGQYGKQMRFDMSKERGPRELRIELQLLDTGLTLDSGSLVLHANGGSKETELRYEVSAEFAWFLKPFMHLKEYEKMMRWRVERVLLNLKTHLDEQGRSDTASNSSQED